MQLERYRVFIDELKRDQSISASIHEFEVYRYFSGNWFDSDGNAIEDTALKSKLEQIRSSKTIFKERSSRDCFFPLQELEAVVKAIFNTSPRKKTQVKLNQQIMKCLKHSTDAFEATHDSHTGLLNKSSFRELILHNFQEQLSPKQDSIEVTNELSSPISIAILALDIDHFKQVNDTYGHLYGDVVIRCYAQRLEKKARDMERSLAGKIRIYLARPGGEEFSALIISQITDAELHNLSEQFRRIIVDEPLPSDQEWNQTSKDTGIRGLTLPHISDRRITTSVGIASVSLSITTAKNSQEEAVTELLNQADTALYKAKAGGRNTVRHFGDILSKYGRILEHHTETGIVTIDIGRQVKVTPGQEFLVYHPDFGGSTPYIFSDGRTKKRLGTYPKYSYGRIVAIDVQPEITFCKVLESKSEKPFPIGSILEVVPLGSIAHLITAEPQMGGVTSSVLNLTPADKLPQFVESILSSNKQPFAAVLKINNLNKLLSERGSSFVNQSLAKLYGVIRTNVSDEAIIGQLKTTEFAVLIETSSELSKNQIQTVRNILLQSKKECSGLVEFVAGIFSPFEIGGSLPGNKSNPDVKKALDFARYAASDEGRKVNNEVEIFTPETGVQIISSWRDKRRYSQGVADYLKLRELGINYAYLENRAAQVAYDAEDLELAAEALVRAHEIDPAPGAYVGNLGVVEYVRGNRITAYLHLKKSLEIDEKYKMPRSYKGIYALSMYAKYKEDPASINKSDLINYIAVALEDPKNYEEFNIDKSELEAALNDLKQAGHAP